MKLNGIVGKGTGKLGSSVFAVSGGEQIVRQYNPNVSNPNTDAQVEQRAKLKLMSQLAAALAPAIAFKKQGLVSARNQFISKNIQFCSFENGKAVIDLSYLTLTGKNTVLPELEGSIGEGSVLSVQLESNASATVDAVVYVVCTSEGNSKINVLAIKPVSVAGNNGVFPTSFENVPQSVNVFAYGVKFQSEAQRVRYMNYVTTATGAGAELSVNEIEALRAGEPTETKYLAATL